MRRKDPGHFALFAKRLRQDSNLLPPASKSVAPLSTASASIQPVTSIEGQGGHSDGLPPRGAQRTLRSGTQGRAPGPFLLRPSPAHRPRGRGAPACIDRDRLRAVRARRTPACPGVQRHPAASRGPRRLHPQGWACRRKVRVSHHGRAEASLSALSRRRSAEGPLHVATSPPNELARAVQGRGGVANCARCADGPAPPELLVRTRPSGA